MCEGERGPGESRQGQDAWSAAHSRMRRPPPVIVRHESWKQMAGTSRDEEVSDVTQL